MIFPLTNRSLIRGAAAHIAAGLGAACDYVANYQPLYAPVDGHLTHFDEAQGGEWLWLHGADGKEYQFAHLSERRGDGPVLQGQQIGKTGNTGTETTGPHLHLQVFTDDTLKHRLDPEPIFANVPLAGEGNTMTQQQELEIITPGLVAVLMMGFQKAGKPVPANVGFKVESDVNYYFSHPGGRNVAQLATDYANGKE